MSRPRIPADVIRRVRAASGERCGYCRSPQWLVMAVFEVEHIIPVARGGTDDEENLWLSCPVCNGHKSAKIEEVDPETRTAVPLFNPRTQRWVEHFRWSEDGLRVEGLTPTGRATVIALRLADDPLSLTVRASWVVVGWHPHEEERVPPASP